MKSLLVASGLAIVLSTACTEEASPSPTGSTSVGVCSEPPSCPAPDASTKPVVTCVTPPEVVSGEAFTLHLFGTHLQDSRGGNTKVALDGETGIEGIPVTACHLTLAIPAGYFAAPKDVVITVATATTSDPTIFPVR